MEGEPIDIALRHIAETQRLLQSLITSSESFDYPKAKVALRQLQKKTRELAKLQAELAKQKSSAPNIHVLDFRVTAAMQNP